MVVLGRIANQQPEPHPPTSSQHHLLPAFTQRQVGYLADMARPPRILLLLVLFLSNLSLALAACKLPRLPTLSTQPDN